MSLGYWLQTGQGGTFEFLIVILTFAFLLLTSPIYAAGATLTLSPASGTFNKGCTFSVDIKLDTGGAQTDGTDAILFYDQSRFAANTIRSGSIYSDYPGNNIDSTQGRITVSGLSSVSSAFSGNGTLASVDFIVLDTAPAGATIVRFDFDPQDKTKTTDSNVVERGTVTDILSQASNGNYVIGSGSCGTTITTVPGGGGSGGRGGTNDNTTPFPTQTLPQGGAFENTLILGSAGVLLTILGILGLILL